MLGPDLVALDALAVWAPVAYEGPARALVGALKYRGARDLAGPMAAWIAGNAPLLLLAEPARLVPVPLHPSRRRRRGFNQAELIARELARRAGLSVDDCLARRGPAGRQVGRGRAERLEGPHGHIEMRRDRAPPLHVLLVDDVVTTGATLGACAQALRAAGSLRVGAVAFARTPGR